jgi:hypothetical protein
MSRTGGCPPGCSPNHDLCRFGGGLGFDRIDARWGRGFSLKAFQQSNRVDLIRTQAMSCSRESPGLANRARRMPIFRSRMRSGAFAHSNPVLTIRPGLFCDTFSSISASDYESAGQVFESPRARSRFLRETSHLVSVVARA